MTDTRDSVQAVGKILSDFTKSGPKSLNHLTETEKQVTAIAVSAMKSAEHATENYMQTCREFLDGVERVRGMPTRVVSGGKKDESDIVSSSGGRISQKFQSLLPSIIERFDWCIKNYNLQSNLYLNDQLDHFHKLLRQFLEQIPAGGSRDTGMNKQISEIKRELRSLTKWDQLFDVYKARSFSAEIEYLFALEGKPIAAVWHYSSLDEQCEYRKTYGHKQRDGQVYGVRDNWAIEQGFMQVRTGGYVDDISRPGQEIGCMCHLQWIYGGIGKIPGGMLTEKGQSELVRVRNAIDPWMMNASTTDVARAGSGEQKPAMPAEPDAGRNAFRHKLLRWFGRG